MVPRGPLLPLRPLSTVVATFLNSRIVDCASSSRGLSLAMTEPMTSSPLGISTSPSSTRRRPSALSSVGMNDISGSGCRTSLPGMELQRASQSYGAGGQLENRVGSDLAVIGILDVEADVHLVLRVQGDLRDLADLEPLQHDGHPHREAVPRHEAGGEVVVLREPALIDADKNEDGGNADDRQKDEEAHDLVGEANLELHLSSNPTARPHSRRRPAAPAGRCRRRRSPPGAARGSPACEVRGSCAPRRSHRQRSRSPRP